MLINWPHVVRTCATCYGSFQHYTEHVTWMVHVYKLQLHFSLTKLNTFCVLLDREDQEDDELNALYVTSSLWL